MHRSKIPKHFRFMPPPKGTRKPIFFLFFFFCLSANAQSPLSTGHTQIHLVDAATAPLTGDNQQNIQLAELFLNAGYFYKAISLCEQYTESDPVLLAQKHLLLAKVYDRLLLEEHMLHHVGLYRKYITRAFPNKKIYESLYYAFLSRYYNLRMMADKGLHYSRKSLQLWQDNPADAHLVPGDFIYLCQLFSARNAGFSFDDKMYYFQQVNRLQATELSVDQINTRISASMFLLDSATVYYYQHKDQPHYHNAMADLMADMLEEAISSLDQQLGFYNPYSARFNLTASLVRLYQGDVSMAIAAAQGTIDRLTADGALDRGAFSPSNFLLVMANNYLDMLYDIRYEQTGDIRFLQDLEQVHRNMDKVWRLYMADRVNSDKQYNQSAFWLNPYPAFQRNYLRLYTLTGEASYRAKYYNSAALAAKYAQPGLSNSTGSLPDRKAYEQVESALAELNMGNTRALADLSKRSFNQYDQLVKEITSFQRQKAALRRQEAIISFSQLNQDPQDDLVVQIICHDRDTVWMLPMDKLPDINLISTIQAASPDDFSNDSYQLYATIMKPVIEYLSDDITDLIIDKGTGQHRLNFPLELLIIDLSAQRSFKQLDYLGQRYNITYASAVSPEKNARVEHAITVFVAENPSLPPLVYKDKFLKGLKEHYQVKVIEGSKSTRQALIQALEADPVLIIIAHGVTQEGIPAHDGFLHAEDIASLQSNCQLLAMVGSQPEQDGGPISLTQAFTRSGVEGMLMSHWDTDEQASLMIIEQWLHYLHAGHSKSEALRKSQHDFLQYASVHLSAPVHWGAFSIMGNNNPIALKESRQLHLVLSGAMGALMLILILGQKIARQRLR
jgi:hypothetical protein